MFQYSPIFLGGNIGYHFFLFIFCENPTESPFGVMKYGWMGLSHFGGDGCPPLLFLGVSEITRHLLVLSGESRVLGMSVIPLQEATSWNVFFGVVFQFSFPAYRTSKTGKDALLTSAQRASGSFERIRANGGNGGASERDTDEKQEGGLARVPAQAVEKA